MKDRTVKYIQIGLIVILFIVLILVGIFFLRNDEETFQDNGKITVTDEDFGGELDIMPDPDVSFTDQLKGVAEVRYENDN